MLLGTVLFGLGGRTVGVMVGSVTGGCVVGIVVGTVVGTCVLFAVTPGLVAIVSEESPGVVVGKTVVCESTGGEVTVPFAVGVDTGGRV